MDLRLGNKGLCSVIKLHEVEKVVSIKNSCATNQGKGGEFSSAPFCEFLLEKGVLFLRIYGLNFHLKRSFNSILEKNNQNFSLWVPSFVSRTRNVYQSAPISRNLTHPERFLVVRLEKVVLKKVKNISNDLNFLK